MRGHAGHIFNLGWGVLPGTDPDQLARVVDVVHGATTIPPVSGQASGRYYVDSQCIDCDLCRETAPANFIRNDEETTEQE